MRKRCINWICRKPENGLLNEVREVCSLLAERRVQRAGQVGPAGPPLRVRGGSWSWHQRWCQGFCYSKRLKMVCSSSTIKNLNFVTWKMFSVFCPDGGVLGRVQPAQVCGRASTHWGETLNRCQLCDLRVSECEVLMAHSQRALSWILANRIIGGQGNGYSKIIFFSSLVAEGSKLFPGTKGIFIII